MSDPNANSPTAVGERSWFRVVWACALALSFLISVLAAFRGGYVGGDYNTHLARILDSTKLFDFNAADPPIFVLVSHGFFRLIGRNNGFVITLSILQAAINALALWWFFLYAERRFKSPVLHLALALFLTFLPVRVIHAASIGPDWTTIPVFVLVLFLFDRFSSEETSTLKNAALLGLTLALGIWCKYSFMALLPAIFVIFAFLWWRRAWKLKRFVAICALSLVLPTALVLFSSWQSFRVKGFTTHKFWLPKGGVAGQPEMDYKDLFLVKVRDLQLFKAPEEFTPDPGERSYHVGFRRPHLHSYLGLSHMGIFTDPMNLFQDLPGPQNVDRFLIPDFKTRRPWKTRAMVAAVSMGSIWTVLAVIGTPWMFFGAVKRLWRDKFEREDTAALLGVAYFLLMFLPIPFVYWGMLHGYWMPRLILPSLLCFSLAGFLLLDRTIFPKSEKIAWVVLALVIIQSGIDIVTMV